MSLDIYGNIIGFIYLNGSFLFVTFFHFKENIFLHFSYLVIYALQL